MTIEQALETRKAAVRALLASREPREIQIEEIRRFLGDNAPSLRYGKRKGVAIDNPDIVRTATGVTLKGIEGQFPSVKAARNAHYALRVACKPLVLRLAKLRRGVTASIRPSGEAVWMKG